MPVMLHRPPPASLHALVLRSGAVGLTYEECGATTGALPTGYAHQRESVALGTGSHTWRAARSALLAWAAHQRGGVNVTPKDAPLLTGQVVAVSARLGPLWIVAPCRIVYVTDTPDRYGFAYGTLPGHPESGEEAFHLVRDTSGAVRFEITAFSRPAAVLARLGRPVTTALQRRATHRYLEGLRGALAGFTTRPDGSGPSDQAE